MRWSIPLVALLLSTVGCTGADACLAHGDADVCDGHDDGGSDEEDRAPNILELEGDPIAGQPVFTSTCGDAACHGSDGDSGPAADLSYHVPLHSDVDVVGWLLDGSGDMPPQTHLSDQQIADVIAYMREQWG